MSALITRSGQIASKFRKYISAVGIVVKNAADDLDTAAPTITSGTGVPAIAQPNGSIFLRTDGGDADTAIYVRQGGAWIAMLGAT